MKPDDWPDHTFALDDPDLSRIGLTNDVIFRHLFARRERKDWLLALVNALLELEGDLAFTSLEILDSVQSREHLLERDAVVDIIAVDGSGKQVHVEVQLLNHPGFVARILYYWAKLYSRQLGPKDTFSKLKSTVSLVIYRLFRIRRGKATACALGSKLPLHQSSALQSSGHSLHTASSLFRCRPQDPLAQVGLHIKAWS